MPAETPAPVTILPSKTTRWPVGSAPSRRQLVHREPVPGRAGGPSSSPAAARISEPVQTEVVQVLVRSAARSQSSISSPGALGDLARAAGHDDHVGVAGSSARERSASSVSMPLSVRTGPASAATKVTRAPGSRLSTS